MKKYKSGKSAGVKSLAGIPVAARANDYSPKSTALPTSAKAKMNDGMAVCAGANDDLPKSRLLKTSAKAKMEERVTEFVNDRYKTA